MRCPKCKAEICLVPVQTVVFQDLEGMPEGAKSLAKQVLRTNASLMRLALGSIETAYGRGTLDPVAITRQKSLAGRKVPNVPD